METNLAFTLTYESFPAPEGPLRYAAIPWDSELFACACYDLKCAAVSPEQLVALLPEWLDTLPKDRNQMVATRINPADVKLMCTLTRHGFYPVETLLYFHLPLSRLTPIIRHPPGQYRFGVAREKDIPAIRAIASVAFSTDRFHLDPHLPSDKADLRYANWIEAGFHAGDRIFVLEDVRSRIIGFVQGHDTAPDTIDMSLGAIDPAYHHKGAGVWLSQCVFEDSRTRHYKTATTRISINNLTSIKPIVRLGFTIRQACITLHWFRYGEGFPQPS